MRNIIFKNQILLCPQVLYCNIVLLITTKNYTKGRLPALPVNIRLGWEWLSVTDTVADNTVALINAVQSFIAHTRVQPEGGFDTF